MKTNTPHLITLGAALLLTPLINSFALSTWETTDALTPWRGRAIIADPAGNFISLAIDNSTSSTGPVSTAVSVSSDAGLTWQTVGYIPGYALKLTATPDGTLFASGNRSATVSGQAFIWKSSDHGTNWSISNPWAGQTTSLISMDLASGNSGVIYVCGYILGGGRWILRKGEPTPTGITWTTVDDFAGSQPGSISVRPGPAGQPDYIVVCGQANSPWTVRASSDSGNTWSTIDSNSLGIVQGVTVGLDGSTYVIGRTTTTTTVTNQTIVKKRVVITTTTITHYNWLVRKSSNGGATWANVDSVTDGWPAPGSSLMVDGSGRILAVGWFNISGAYTWLARGSIDGGITWANTDLFLPPGFTGSQAYCAAADALGNLCVVGEMNNGTATSDVAPVRRLGAP